MLLTTYTKTSYDSRKYLQREPTIDVLKGIGILLMVWGHTSVCSEMKVWIYGFHMPLFFFLSGYVFSYEKWERLGFCSFVLSRFKGLLLPYFTFSLINLIVKIAVDASKFGQTVCVENTKGYLIGILYSHDTMMPNCAPLWFLTALFTSSIYFWYLVRWGGKNVRISLFMMLAYIVLLHIIVIELRAYGISQLPWHVDVAFVGSLFMFIGYRFKGFFQRSKASYKYNLFAAILIIVATFFISINGRINMVTNQYQNILLFIIGAVTMCVGLYILVDYASKKKALSPMLAPFCYLGKHTLVFIGFNYMVNAFVRLLMEKMGILPYYYNIIDMIAVVSICLCITLFYSKCKKILTKSVWKNQ